MFEQVLNPTERKFRTGLLPQVPVTRRLVLCPICRIIAWLSALIASVDSEQPAGAQPSVGWRLLQWSRERSDDRLRAERCVLSDARCV